MQLVLIAVGAIFVASGCSSMPGQTESGKELAAQGPTILNVRAEPSSTIELNRSLKPLQSAEILADVKDFRSKVQNVQLKFLHVPIQVPMENIGGTTWRAQLTPEQLRMLAVSGKTIKYDANIVATNEQGQAASSSSPITIGVKAPELAQTG